MLVAMNEIDVRREQHVRVRPLDKDRFDALAARLDFTKLSLFSRMIRLAEQRADELMSIVPEPEQS